VRSNTHIDRITWHYDRPNAIVVNSAAGQILIAKIVDQPLVIPLPNGTKRIRWSPLFKHMHLLNSRMKWWFGVMDDPNWTGVYFPHWTFILILAALPWLPWSNRFSLRTLFIAVTLLAVILGFIIALIHSK
jgi:hypothetical protein